MLDTIRRHQQSWLTYLIFGAIIVVFAVNFGPGSSSCGQGGAGQGYAAVVDGDYIPQQDFAVAYTQQVEQLRRRAQAGNFDLTEKMIEQMGIRDRVVDQLIGEKLLAREAARRGLRVGDDELLAYLDKVYKVSSVSAEDYRAFVERNFRTTVQRFEDKTRGELAAQKMAQVIEDTLAISDEELKTAFVRDHDRATVLYTKLDLSSIKLSDPTPAEIDKLIASDTKAIEDRYQADAGLYRTAEQRQARQIFVAMKSDASEADVARARSQLVTFKDQVASGADFATLAKEHSQDAASKDKGGDLGWHKAGELDPALDEVIFTLKALEISAEPVRTNTGLHLLQLVTIKPSEQRPLDEVKRDVAASILRERGADAVLKANADKLLAELKAGKKLEDITDAEDAKKAGATAKADVKKPVRYESPWILKSQEAIPRIGIAPELHKAIFALTKDSPLAPAAYKVGRAYYVVVLKERELPDMSKFDSEKEALRDQALWGKRTQVFQAWVQHLRDKARVELNPALFGAERRQPMRDDS